MSIVTETYTEEVPDVESTDRSCYLPHKPEFKSGSSTRKTPTVLDSNVAATYQGLALFASLPKFVADACCDYTLLSCLLVRYIGGLRESLLANPYS